ncbi:MAG: hypothetical protein JXA57_17005 [Armatimonadetes bacterium]|nr:hypothetical protein [Armatimonadota bacterium]
MGFLALFEGAGVRQLKVEQQGHGPIYRPGRWVLARHEDTSVWGLLASGIRSAQLGTASRSDSEEGTRFTIWETTEQGERVHVVMFRQGLLCSASPPLGAMAEGLAVGPDFFRAMERLTNRPRITTFILPAEECSQRLLADTPISADEARKLACRFVRTCEIDCGERIRVAAHVVSDGQRAAIVAWRVKFRRTELRIDASEGYVTMAASAGDSIGIASGIHDENDALARGLKVAEAMRAGTLARECSCRVGQNRSGTVWSVYWNRDVGVEPQPILRITLSAEAASLQAFRDPWPRYPVDPITADQALAAGRTVAKEILGVEEDEVEMMSEPQLFALDSETVVRLATRIPEGRPQPVPVWLLGFDSAGGGHAGLYLSAEDGRVLEVTSYSPPHRGDIQTGRRRSSDRGRARAESRETNPLLYLILAVVGASALLTIVVIILRTSPKSEH